MANSGLTEEQIQTLDAELYRLWQEKMRRRYPETKKGLDHPESRRSRAARRWKQRADDTRIMELG